MNNMRIFLRRGHSGRSRKASCPKPSPRFSLCPEQWNLREAFWEECPCGHCSLVCRTSGFIHVKNVTVLRRCTIKLFSSSGVSQALWRKKHQAAGLFISCMNKKEKIEFNFLQMKLSLVPSWITQTSGSEQTLCSSLDQQSPCCLLVSFNLV